MEELGEGVDPEIAAIMGFSSFGSKNKRRRENQGENKVAKTSRPDSEVETTGKSVVSEIAAPGTSTTDQPLATVPEVQAIKPDAAESREAVYQRQPETPIKHSHQKRKRSPVATSLADFLARGKNLPDRPETSAAEKDEAVAASAAAPDVQEMTIPPTANPILEKTLEELTPTDLSAFTYGVPNEKGDLVFFQMNFLDDPWETLRMEAGKG